MQVKRCSPFTYKYIQQGVLFIILHLRNYRSGWIGCRINFIEKTKSYDFVMRKSAYILFIRPDKNDEL